jgi:serine/threonine-protein kinase
VSAYCIALTEVTVGEYRACLDAGVCAGTPRETHDDALCNFSVSPAGRETHPLNCTQWADGRQYCQDWLGGDLPTEAQWEKAARGAGNDTRKYPWGASPEPTCSLCNWDTCYSSVAPSTWPVGHLSSGAGDSPFGLKDMAGNVWEFTRDTYDDDIYQSCTSNCTDPSNVTAGSYKTIRGGGYYHPDANYLRVTERAGEYDDHWSLNAGFRCVRSP